MKKLLIFALMTSLFANSQTAPLPLTAENLVFYKSAFPTILGNYPTDNNNPLAGQLGTSIDVNQQIRVDGTIISTSIFNSYVFQVTDIKSGVVGYVNTTTPYFLLKEVKDSNNNLIPNFVKVNRSYNIKVKGNGSTTYPRYGNNCIVMTRPLIITNLTKVRVPQGNSSITSVMPTAYDQISLIGSAPNYINPMLRIRRTDILNQPSYETRLVGNSFLFRNGGDPLIHPDLPTNYFVLGATYCVDVAVFYPETNTVGDYSDNVSACYTYGTAINAKMSNNEDINSSFDAVISPNPSKDNFSLNLKTESKSLVQVDVYDITGKIIEKNIYDLDTLSNLNIGDKYQSGIYNIIITQDENTKTVKLIKE